MQGWKEGVVPAGKGTREPRPSPNQDQKTGQDGQRHLVVLQGGDPGSVTHRSVRRGSRPRGGSNRETKADTLAKLAKGEIRDWHLNDAREEEGSAQVISLAAVPSQSEAPFIKPAASPSEDKPYMWTERDFTPEALAEYDKQHAARSIPTTERHVLRRSLEGAAVRFQKNRYQPKPPSAFEKEGRCTSQINLRDQEDQTVGIRHITLKSSHTGTDRQK